MFPFFSVVPFNCLFIQRENMQRSTDLLRVVQHQVSSSPFLDDINVFENEEVPFLSHMLRVPVLH
jgi:hypothetical protein